MEMESLVKLIEMISTTPMIVLSALFLLFLGRRKDVRGISFFIRRRYVQVICGMVMALGVVRFFRILFYEPDGYYSPFFMLFVVIFSCLLLDVIGRLNGKS